MSKHTEKSDFVLEGRFLGFVVKKGYKIRALQLANSTGEHTIKLPKELRAKLGQRLVPGEWLKVSGSQKIDFKDNTVKLKAKQIEKGSPSANPASAPTVSAADLSSAPQPKIPSTKILVCQKSDCCKRGGRAVSQALQQALSDRNLTDQVTIKGTGCMKHCKAGPNIVMPDKTRYSRIRPNEIPAIIDKHFEPALEQSHLEQSHSE